MDLDRRGRRRAARLAGLTDGLERIRFTWTPDAGVPSRRGVWCSPPSPTTPRDWWRLAHTLDGRLAGFTVPTHNPDAPVVGYLGVVPDLRAGYRRTGVRMVFPVAP